MKPDFIPLSRPSLSGNELKYVARCFESTEIGSEGEFIPKFEKMVAAYVKSKFAASVSNATTGLHLALKCLGVKKGDEVIIPDLTFVSTANAVTYLGAKPVLVDVCENWLLDVDKLKPFVNKKTKAIVAVDLYGHPCDFDPIIEFAHQRSISVIDDAAEAIGAEYKGKKIGSIADVSLFSFQYKKTVTTGEGGIITTDDKELFEKASLLKNHGINSKNEAVEIGFNYRMSNIQAAIGVAQMERAETLVASKIRVANAYKKFLSEFSSITLPMQEKWAKSVFWFYTCLLNDSFKISREKLIQHLSKNGVQSRPFFKPLHESKIYPSKKKFPVSSSISKKGISLPSYDSLSDAQIERICQIIKKAGS